MADGVAPADVYKVLGSRDGVDRAFKKLDTIKNEHRLVGGGRAAAAAARVGRSGDDHAPITAASTAANKSDKRTSRSSGTGSVYAVDSWVILKGSPNKDAGLKFIAFASDAKRRRNCPRSWPTA